MSTSWRCTVSAVASLASLLLSACSAQTEPATNVGSTTATLSARGASDATPAHYEFQYAISEAALGNGFGKQTPTRGPISTGQSGPFSETVSGLAPGTTYFFRVCGGDGNVHPDVCAPPRSFTTTEPGATVAFAAPVSYPVHSAPAAIALANLTGPHSRDLATANPATNDVSVLLNHGDGAYDPAVNYATDTGPTAVAAGNFTGAGRRDIVTANGASDISVLLGRGDGTLAPAVNYALPGVPQSVVVGDVNGDGHQDVVVFEDLPRYTGGPGYGDTPPGVVSVLLGRGDGTFGAPINTTVIPAVPCGVHGVCPTPEDVTLAFGLVQGAGAHPGLVLGGTSAAYDAYVNLNEGTGFTAVLTGNGDGSFQVKTVTYLPGRQLGLGPAANAVSGLALGDLNGDGKLDQAYLRADREVTYVNGSLTEFWTNEVEVAAGAGDGTFGAPAVAATLPISTQLPTADAVRTARLSAPAHRDLVVATNQALSVLAANGGGSFQAPVTVDGSAAAVVSADLNGDGKVDLADVPFGSASVHVLDNASAGG